jgi:acetolactate synthase-1/2/3 large subunit
MITNKSKVSDLVAQTLEKLGITHVFGIIGAGNVHIFESIAKHGYTEIICVHHEQAAAMAMQTYYRTSGKLSACLLTTGAGSTNGVTGVLSAWADSIPGIIIAGNENSKHTQAHSPYRMWGVQGYDSVHMVDKITKYSHRVLNPLQAQYELEKASYISLDQRPGPVWIEIPMDIQSSIVDANMCDTFVEPVAKNYQTLQLDNQLEHIVDSLANSPRPVLWLGHGIKLAGAEGKLIALLDKLGAPALVSWAGIDMVDSDHPLVFGRAGVYGQRAANFVLQNSSYVLSIGTRLAIPQIGYNLSELARAADIDVVDIDITEATKNQTRTREHVVCDAGVFIDLLMAKLETVTLQSKSDWIDKCNYYKYTFPWVSDEHEDRDGFINSYPFMERLNKHFKPNQIVVTDMGTALLSGHQVLKFKPGQRFMTSTGLGEMGYGLPGAIGASIASNYGEVMCLNCDGGMMMNLQELQTIVHYNLPIKLFIFNNDGYLMIKHTQTALFKGNRIGVDKATGVSCPDFSKLATAFNIPSYQIRDWDTCDDILEKVQNTEGPVICEVFMHPNQLFSPKLGWTAMPDGTQVSSPLEDLSPLVSGDKLDKAMIIGLHEKSKGRVKAFYDSIHPDGL